MNGIDCYLVETLYLMKLMHDGGMERLANTWRECELDSDYCQEMAYEAIGGVFADTRMFYNEEREFEIFVFCDPLIDDFCRLCGEYEIRGGIEAEKNPYRVNMEKAIRSGLSFNSYAYDYIWYLTPKDRGRRRFVLFFDPEFYFVGEVPAGLLEVRDAFEYQIKLLREALRVENTNISLLSEPNTYGEAA